MTERPAIPQESVSSAAESLVAANKAPSVMAVAEMMGSKDYAAIMPRLQFWRMNRALKSAPHGALTEALIRSLDPIGDDIADVAEATLRRASAVADQKAAEIRTAAEKKTGELEARNGKLTSDLQALNRRLDVLEAEAAKVKALASRVSELETALSESNEARARAKQRAEDLSAEVSAAAARAEKAEAALAATEQTLHRTAEERDSARQSLDAAEQTVTHLEQQLSAHQQATEELQREAEQVQQRMQAEGYWLLDESDMKEVPKRLALATVRMSALKAERDGLREHLAEVQHRLDQTLKLLEIRAGAGPTILAHAPTAPAAGRIEQFPAKDQRSGPQIEVVR